MPLNQETQALINSLPDPILIIELGPRRGRVVAYNTAFVHELGAFEGNFEGRSFIRMPQFTRTDRRGLMQLLFRAKNRKDDRTPFVFQYSDPKGKLKTLSAAVEILHHAGRECALLYLRVVLSNAVTSQQAEDMAAFNILIDMTRDPCLEFRPRIPIPPDLFDKDKEDRLVLLRSLGHEFIVHKSNGAAQNLFGPKNAGNVPAGSTLVGRSFISLFHREMDALMFLDMLVSTGQLRAPVALLNGNGRVVETEMACSARFGTGDTIAAIYCIPRLIEQNRNIQAQNGMDSQEQDFLFTQPFIGLGHLVPLQPLVRPNPEEADAVLDRYLNEILLVNTNDTLGKLYGVHKNNLLMQHMTHLFPYRSAGIQVLKELFVTRTSSFATYNEDTGEFMRIALFKAIFNKADQLVRILLAVSTQACESFERHSNQKLSSTPSFI